MHRSTIIIFKVIGWLDPLTGFTRSFFEIGNTSYSLAETTSHYTHSVYDVVSDTTQLPLDDDSANDSEAEKEERSKRDTIQGLFSTPHDNEIVKLESNFNPQLYIILFLLVDIAILGLGFWIFYKRIII